MGDELRARRVKRLAKNDPRFKHLPNVVAERFAEIPPPEAGAGGWTCGCTH